MRVVLIRHAHALPEEENAQRPLSAQGLKDARRLATFFRMGRSLREFTLLWHSPLLRAKETAEAMLPALASDAIMIETPGLQPEDSPEECALRVDRLGHSLVVVGHEPHLSALATVMVRGKVAPAAIEFPKCAALCLESTGRRHKKVDLERWKILWHLPLELLPSEIRYS